jgi:ubiquinone/menaquinone biosynthesis C-methylase UbiE
MIQAAADARAIYSARYAESYPSLYLAPWPRKHRLNAENLNRLLAELAPAPRWLDLACGQAWHFSAFPGRARMVGVDISEAQLRRARSANSDAALVCADMSTIAFAPASFDLVTNFWAAYCYLASRERIAALVRAMSRWVAPGGAIYIEVLLGGDLASFNQSRFSRDTRFAVAPRSDDYSEWQYDDSGGRHVMTSPPLEDFLAILAPRFGSVEAEHDGSFMTHLIARDRR